MNNFNTVFAIVQQQCKDKGVVSDSNIFQHMAAKVGLTMERLHFYLDCLEQTGLISYSWEKKFISLTEKGVLAESVFP